MLRSLCLAVALCVVLAAASNPAAADASDDADISPRDIDARIKAALQWLADHQAPDGFWSASDFAEHSKRAEAKRTGNLQWVNPGKPDGDKGSAADIAMTSMALLAFAGSGYDHREGEYRATIRSALLYLRRQQNNEGRFGDDTNSHVHTHAIATQAISELYGISGDEVLKPMAERAVRYLISQQVEDSGWTNGRDKEPDTQMTGWCVLALKSASTPGLEVEADVKATYEGANKWLDSASGNVRGAPRTGYRKAGDSVPRPSETRRWKAFPETEAVNIMCRLFSDAPGWNLENETLKSQAALIAKSPPAWKQREVDYAHWYFGSMALFQVGGDGFKAWRNATLDALIKNQRGFSEADKDTTPETLAEHGSWDAVGAWHPSGGRVWSTATAALTLQVMARRMRLHGGNMPGRD